MSHSTCGRYFNPLLPTNLCHSSKDVKTTLDGQWPLSSSSTEISFPIVATSMQFHILDWIKICLIWLAITNRKICHFKCYNRV